MIQESKVLDNSLEITCTFDAPVKKVFAALTNAEQMVNWMGPEYVTCENVEVDLRVGGKYRISMKSEQGVHIAVGEYREIETNKKLVFTWHWVDGTFENSIVTILFSETSDGTAINLNHSLLPDRENAQDHSEGWSSSITKLENYLENQE